MGSENYENNLEPHKCAIKAIGADSENIPCLMSFWIPGEGMEAIIKYSMVFLAHHGNIWSKRMLFVQKYCVQNTAHPGVLSTHRADQPLNRWN